jgi:hypothetical protein
MHAPISRCGLQEVVYRFDRSTELKVTDRQHSEPTVISSGLRCCAAALLPLERLQGA